MVIILLKTKSVFFVSLRCKCAESEDSINRKIVSIHKPIIFAFALADQDGNLIETHSEVVLDDNRNAADAFLDYILRRERDWLKMAGRYKPLIETREVLEDFENATICHHCELPFEKIERAEGVPLKVKDHDHYK